jgi:hypothetical protein
MQTPRRLTMAATAAALIAMMAHVSAAPAVSSVILFLGSIANPVAVSTTTGVPDTGTIRILTAQRLTYAAATTAKTATAAGTGPFMSVCGSASKTVRLQSLGLYGTVATAAIYGDIQVRKTSTATSSGTPVALTVVPLDSTNAAGTATATYYTALATTGTNVGMIDTQGAVFPITGTVAASMAAMFFDWTNRQESQAPVLRGVAQCAEVSFGTTPANAPTFSVRVVWTEE